MDYNRSTVTIQLKTTQSGNLSLKLKRGGPWSRVGHAVKKKPQFNVIYNGVFRQISVSEELNLTMTI